MSSFGFEQVGDERVWSVCTWWFVRASVEEGVENSQEGGGGKRSFCRTMRSLDVNSIIVPKLIF